MTEQEEQELHRVEINFFRLREFVLLQQETILDLRKELQAREVELQECRHKLELAERQIGVFRDASALGQVWSGEVIDRLDEMIQEVTCCIEQLEAE